MTESYYDIAEQELADRERDEYAALLEQNDDKWGMSPEANKKVIREMYQQPAGHKEFLAMCRGEMSREEYEQIESAADKQRANS